MYRWEHHNELKHQEIIGARQERQSKLGYEWINLVACGPMDPFALPQSTHFSFPWGSTGSQNRSKNEAGNLWGCMLTNVERAILYLRSMRTGASRTIYVLQLRIVQLTLRTSFEDHKRQNKHALIPLIGESC